MQITKGATKQGQLEVKAKMEEEKRETLLKARPCYFEDKAGFENFPTQN